MTKPHLYIHVPTITFQALVNKPGVITYPITSIPFDNVSLGAYTDIEFDATLLLGTEEGSDDLGRVRVKGTATATTITIARSSKGIDDGLITLQDNAYITVLDDFRPWAKLPYFELTDETFIGNDYKDGDVPAGTYNTNIPPVANAGPWVAGYVDPNTNELAVAFPDGVANLSYAMADGATISSYDWDVGGGVITVGTGASAMITATFVPGFYWVKHSVTDSNGVTHSARCAVLAIDPADDPCIREFSMSQRLEKKGQTLEIEIYEDLPRSAYPDGTLVMMWWDEPADENDKSHMKFSGWIANERFGINRKKTGFSRTTSLVAVDIAGYLALLPGFPQALERTASDSLWSYMPSLDMNKALYYIIFWHSTAINLVDFFLPSDGASYNAMRIDANGASIFDQVNTLAMKMVPDHYLTCNTKGQLSVIRDWRLDDVGDRPISAPIITEAYWNELTAEYSRTPKVHSLRSGAILASTAFVVVDTIEEIPLVFSVAPGDAAAFGQGISEAVENEGLALSQDALNKCEGHRYAMLNARYGHFRFKDPTGSNFWNYEPADMKRVQFNISEAKAAQRGLDFTDASGMVHTIAVDYKRDKTGLQIAVDVTWEREVEGYPALTHTPEDSEDIGYVFVPPVFTPGDPNENLTGNIAGYLLWDSADVLRTWDLQAASPTWERIDTGVSGILYDCQYMMVSPSVVGAWLMTSTDIFFCADVLATTPTWSSKLTIATVNAAAVAPDTGTLIFGGMTHYWTAPGHLCVAMSLSDENDNYVHCYYWVTEDYGANWTIVDADADTFGSVPNVRCYYSVGRHGIASHRSEPILYCGRSNGRTGTSTGDTAVFRSEDMGYTWTLVHSFGFWNPAGSNPAILNPYPNTTSPSYLVRAGGGGSTGGDKRIYVSTDGWDTATLLTEPAGHEGGFAVNGHSQRPNKNPFDDLHILALFQIDSSSNVDLYESNDGGTNWTLLEGFGNSAITPNGWPPDPDQWVIVQYDDSPSVQLTLDNFATLLDKTGNLAAVLSGGAWSTGTNAQVGGFALPKVGVNDVP